VDLLTPSPVKAVALLFASSVADPSKQETLLLQAMELNAETARKISDEQ